MKYTLYQVDAFAAKLFAGNPAAVVPLQQWIDDNLMQRIAMENNLAETVFFVPNGNEFNIRWFTPELEINLCGHATLASAFVLYNYLGYNKPEIVFNSKSGPLRVRKDVQSLPSGGFRALMDFPSWKPEKINEYPDGLRSALGVKGIVGVYKYRDLLVELPKEEDVQRAQPDFSAIKRTGEKVIITAPGKQVDFVSRFFAPTAGIDEDPVTGSAHSQLIPFWSEKLGKKKMHAKQLSKRGGEIYCEQKGDRVIMGGECVFYMKGEIEVRQK
jgi:PhzF family phenazine biosynthesis protein